MSGANSPSKSKFGIKTQLAIRKALLKQLNIDEKAVAELEDPDGVIDQLGLLEKYQEAKIKRDIKFAKSWRQNIDEERDRIVRQNLAKQSDILNNTLQVKGDSKL